ncbi:cyclic nucleotide-binding domain-containing protein [Ferrovibrio sp.]|uniref:cyclic nucleotide-binding domain-containing protein n=1 Tax=Ferrovibrio sp. TaxID=1917215 RepID=UPI0035B3B040
MPLISVNAVGLAAVYQSANFGGPMRPSDLQILRETELYQRLGPETLDRLTRHCLVRDVPRNTLLTEQDQPAEYVHVVLRGRVALLAECSDGSNTIVTSFGGGEIFVTAAAVLQLPYLVSAKTVAPSRVLLIPAARFRRALQSEPTLALYMVDVLAHHWRLLVGHLRELKLLTAVERLASYLVARSGATEGNANFVLTEDRRTIAAQLGMRHECLSRSLQKLRANGVIVHGNHVEVKDVAKLKEYFRPVQRVPSAEQHTTFDDQPFADLETAELAEARH